MSTIRTCARLAAATLVLGLAVGGGEAAAVAKTYKCIVSGRTVYQQQACPADAEPAKAADAAAASSPASAASGAGATRKLKPASRPASAAPAKPR